MPLSERFRRTKFRSPLATLFTLAVTLAVGASLVACKDAAANVNKKIRANRMVSRLVDLGPGNPHDRSPFVDFGGDELFEFRG